MPDKKNTLYSQPLNLRRLTILNTRNSSECFTDLPTLKLHSPLFINKNAFIKLQVIVTMSIFEVNNNENIEIFYRLASSAHSSSATLHTVSNIGKFAPLLKGGYYFDSSAGTCCECIKQIGVVCVGYFLQKRHF